MLNFNIQFTKLFSKLNRDISLSLLIYTINLFGLVFYFDESFILVYISLILTTYMYFGYKYRISLKRFLDTTLKSFNKDITYIIVFSASLLSFLLLLYFKTMYNKTHGAHYIIGNTFLKLEYLKLPLDTLLTEYGAFKGEQSITDIWNWPGVVLNRIVIILSHLIAFLTFYYLVILNRITEKQIQLRVLFLACNDPERTLKLGSVGSEDESIKDELTVRAECREHVEFVTTFAVTSINLTLLVNFSKEDVVHYSGHSSLKHFNIYDQLGNYNKVPYESFKNLLANKSIKLVVLNSCNSVEGAKLIAQVVDNVVGTLNVVKDSHAIFLKNVLLFCRQWYFYS